MESLLLLIVFIVALLYFNRLIKKSISTSEAIIEIAVDVVDQSAEVAKDAVATYASKAKVANSSARAVVGMDIKELAEEGKLMSQNELDDLIKGHL